MSLLAEEFCPISETLLGRLYRASPEVIATLIKTVPPETRAMLASYCYRRAHLQTLGLSIAETCSEHDLQSFGGRIGAELLTLARAQKNVAVDNSRPRLKSSKGITLAEGWLWNPAPLQE
jgi:hypothetical protein